MKLNIKYAKTCFSAKTKTLIITITRIIIRPVLLVIYTCVSWTKKTNNKNFETTNK